MQNTSSEGILEEFIRRFPQSVYADFAKARIVELKHANGERSPGPSTENQNTNEPTPVEDRLTIVISELYRPDGLIVPGAKGDGFPIPPLPADFLLLADRSLTYYELPEEKTRPAIFANIGLLMTPPSSLASEKLNHGLQIEDLYMDSHVFKADKHDDIGYLHAQFCSNALLRNSAPSGFCPK